MRASSRVTAYDAIVVGSGATGGWAAKELTRAGLSVVVLEAGPRLGRLSPANEAAFARQPIQSYLSRGLHPALFVDDLDHPYTTPADRPYRWLRSRALGGRTLSWNGITLRFSDLDFRPRDGGDAWPIDHAEIAPFYAEAEHWLGVSGARDHLEQLPDGSFVRPRRMTEGERLVKQRVERRWPDRRVIIQRGVLPEPRWQSTTSTLAAARRTRRLTIRTDAIVSHLVLAGGRARGVACIDRVTGEPFEIRATAIVALCASTIETLRILLASEIDSQALGRYVMDHTMVTMSGRMRAVRRPVAPFRGGPYGIYMPRFRNVDRVHRPFARGYAVQGVVQRWPTRVSGEEGVPFQLTAFGEVLADRTNRVTLDPDRRDAWGLPVARIACGYRDNEAAMVRDELALFDEMAALCDLDVDGDVGWAIPGTSVHECGGARMGTDPRHSVVDRFNRLWHAPNVVVTDGSCFVSSPCQNPTLTMMALTIRACRHLASISR